MASPKINYFINLIMALSFFITALTGIILFFFLPSGIPQGKYQEFLGITKGTWGLWHDYAGLVFIILAFVHIILHWRWAKSMTKAIFKPEKGGKKKNDKVK
jgi:cytochrome b subunit of formate dehydrogenase